MRACRSRYLACRAATDPTAQSILAAKREQAKAEALPLRADESVGDSWGSHTRRLAGLAQGYALLQRHGIAGAGQTAQELLDLAGELHFGFAGFQSPAWLTLAEAIRVCSGDAGSAAVRKVLDSASNSAHNVQDPTFCARTTARFNALRELWWSTPPGGFDAPSLHVALHPDEAVLRHEVETTRVPGSADHRGILSYARCRPVHGSAPDERKV